MATKFVLNLKDFHNTDLSHNERGAQHSKEIKRFIRRYVEFAYDNDLHDIADMFNNMTGWLGETRVVPIETQYNLIMNELRRHALDKSIRVNMVN